MQTTRALSSREPLQHLGLVLLRESDPADPLVGASDEETAERSVDMSVDHVRESFLDCGLGELVQEHRAHFICLLKL